MRWWWGKKAQAPPRIPVKWDFYIRRRGEDLVSVALNLALADPRLRPQSLKVVLWIKVKMRQPTEDGTASPAESPVILQIEDAIADDVGNRLGAIFAGHIMGCGYHEC